MNQPNYYQYADYRTTPYYGYQQPTTSGNVQQPSTYGVQPMPIPQFPTGGAGPTPGSVTIPSAGTTVPGMLPIEQSYIENILRLNKGKLVKVHATFEGNKQRTFDGLIEAAGRDHLILSDPQTGKRYLLPMIYLDYVEFDEEIEYEPPYTPPPGLLSSYSPR